jgi:hypothetical protein
VRVATPAAKVVRNLHLVVHHCRLGCARREIAQIAYYATFATLKTYREIAPTAKPAALPAASCCLLPAQADQTTQAGFLLSLTWLVDYYEAA